MKVPVKKPLDPEMTPPCHLQSPDVLVLKVVITPDKAKIQGEAEEHMFNGHPQKCVAVVFDPTEDCSIEFSHPQLFGFSNRIVPLHAGPNKRLDLKQEKGETSYRFHTNTGVAVETGDLQAECLFTQGTRWDPKIVVP